jgi:hypothetical protein
VPDDPAVAALKKAKRDLNAWRTVVYAYCSVQARASVREELATHSSLELLNGLPRSSGIAEWLCTEVRHPGKLLKVKLRAGALPLMVHVGVSNGLAERGMRQCVLCESGAVETEGHSVADCPFYDDLRTACLARLSGLLLREGVYDHPEIDFLQLVAGSASSQLPAKVRLRAEKCAWDFLRLAWARRQQVWARVCLDGNTWRLSAPR